MTIAGMTMQVLSGVGATMLIFFATIIISMPLGLAIATGRMSSWTPGAKKTKVGIREESKGFKPIRTIFQFFISVIRGTPLMLQLIVWFYGPYYLFGIRISATWRILATIIGFGVNYAAYFAEIFRSGIQGIPVGQREAAKVLGYSNIQTFWKLIFPQMFKAVLPPVTNEIITLVKDTSLAFVLSYMEVFTIAKQVAAAQTTILPLFIAGVFYYIFNAIVAGVMGAIEKKLNYYR